MKKCMFCGSEFTGHFNKKFCSRSCCDKNWRKKFYSDSRNQENRTKYYRIYRKKQRELGMISTYVRSYRVRRKEKLFEILGSHVCIKCGFADKRALQFDHKNGGGVKDQHIHDIYNYYSSHPEEAKQKLQVLCANCNWIKRAENNEIRKFPNIIPQKYIVPHSHPFPKDLST